MELPEFQEFKSIARLKRPCVITEKIDGTNGCVYVGEDGLVIAGCRGRWLIAPDDNHGFAKWVKQNEDTLRAQLGPGRHFGEWWGSGIGKRYGLTEKRFTLFNAKRWTPAYEEGLLTVCAVVPILYGGMFSEQAVDECLENLRVNGSVVAPGFMKPEGVVIYHAHANMMFKKTLENDEVPKSTLKEEETCS